MENARIASLRQSYSRPANLLLHLTRRIGTEKSRVTLFASMRARSSCTQPYASQHMIPRLSIRYMMRDISSVLRVRRVSTAWGRKENVVSIAARKPMFSIMMVA
jgi:hypothetical protein